MPTATKDIDGQKFVRITEQTLYLIDTIKECDLLMERLITATEEYMPVATANQKQLIEEQKAEFAKHIDTIRGIIASWVGESISANLSQSEHKEI